MPEPLTLRTPLQVYPEGFDIPQTITERYKQLCELVNGSEYGNLKVEDLAAYLGVSTNWLRSATSVGAVPFGFGTNEGKKRGYFRFSVLAVFNYEMQGILYKMRMTNERLKSYSEI